MQGFPQVFGYVNESFAKRLYLYLSNYKLKARISFEQFLRRFFKMLYGTVMEKNRISFSIYDYDCNGSISSLDIYDLLKHYQEGSKLYIEADLIIKDITNNLGRARKSDNYFNYNYFSYMIKSSYISKEIVNKIANGIETLSFHDPKCTLKWDQILSEKNLKQSTQRNFITIIMKKYEKKKKDEENVKDQQKEVSKMMWR